MIEAVLSLIFGAALTLGSPGPAPISLALVSSNFGVKRGLKYLGGILSGLFFVSIVTGFGLFEVLKRYPNVLFVLAVFAFLYMIYIAWKIAFADISLSGQNEPPSFKDGFVLNISNPKAYAAFFSLYSTFLLPHSDKALAILLTGLIGFGVGVVVDVLWTLLGASLSVFIKSSPYAPKIRILCGVFLVLTLLYSALRAQM